MCSVPTPQTLDTEGLQQRRRSFTSGHTRSCGQVLVKVWTQLLTVSWYWDREPHRLRTVQVPFGGLGRGGSLRVPFGVDVLQPETDFSCAWGDLIQSNPI